MAKLTVSEVISCAMIAFMCLFATLPVIGSMLPTESSAPDDVTYTGEINTGEIIDSGMAFLISPEEVVVNVNDTFVIQVGVENVTDMYGWQVFFRFDSQIVECADVFLPFDHVFSYGVTVGGALVSYNATEFTNPLYRLWNDEGRVIAGNCLLGANQSTFNGSGTLCNIEFRAISAGASTINLCLYSDFDSYVLDSRLRAVKPPSGVDCHVICSEP